jgi:hypothetical protein
MTYLFLNNLKAGFKARELILNFEKNYAHGLDTFATDIEKQKTSFKEKVRTKRKSNYQEQKNEGSQSHTFLVEDLLQKFHNSYMHKIIDYSCQTTIESMNLQYTNRVELYSSYQDEIKNFEIVKVMSRGNNSLKI